MWRKLHEFQPSSLKDLLKKFRWKILDIKSKRTYYWSAIWKKKDAENSSKVHQVLTTNFLYLYYLMRRCPKISANFCRIETTPFSCMILRLTQKWYYWRPVHLPILVQYLIFISHEKVRKPKVFWRFQKTWNRTIEIKWVELIQAR